MTTTLLELKPSQIKPHKLNVRREVGDVDELAASIKEQGVVEPLVVVPGDGGYIAEDGVAVGPFILIAGHRRLAAAKQAKAKTVPCLVRDDLTDPKKQIELMLVENLQRADLSAVEEAEAYQTLLTFPGYTQKRIAETTGRAIGTVRGRLKMAGLPKSALAKIHEGQIPLVQVDALVGFQADTSAFKRLIDVAGTDRFVQVLDDVTRRRKAERAQERLTSKLTEQGVRLIDRPSYTDKVTWLYGKNIDEHGDCAGFAAFVAVNSYSGSADVTYVCDQPALHSDDPAADTGQDAVREAQKRALEEAAPIRRAWLRDHVLGDPSDGLALDVLRQLLHAKIGDNLYGTADKELVTALLGVPADDKKARAKAIDDLDWRQCAILLDLVAHAGDDAALRQPHNWSPSGYTKKWRARLTGLYGYTWSIAEAEVLDAQLAEYEARNPTPDVDDDDDGNDDDDDGPESTDEP